MPPVLIERLRHDIASRRDWPAEAVAVAVEDIRERPYSTIARARVSGPAGFVAQMYLKTVRLGPGSLADRALLVDRITRDYRIAQSIARVLPDDGDIRVVTPVACYPDLLAIVTEAAPGDTLLNVLGRTAAWPVSDSAQGCLQRTFSRIGRWLSIVQQKVPSPDGSMIDPGAVAEYIDVRLRRLTAISASGVTEQCRRRLLDGVAGLLAVVDRQDRRQVVVHADFALGNILVTPDRITVLDLTMTSAGARYHDLAHLYLQLSLLSVKPRHRPSIVACMQQALLAGFGEPAAEDHPLFRVLLLQHVVCHYLGLFERRDSIVGRLYNRLVMRRHFNWLRQFNMTASRSLGVH